MAECGAAFKELVWKNSCVPQKNDFAIFIFISDLDIWRLLCCPKDPPLPPHLTTSLMEKKWLLCVKFGSLLVSGEAQQNVLHGGCLPWRGSSARLWALSTFLIELPASRPVLEQPPPLPAVPCFFHMDPASSSSVLPDAVGVYWLLQL
jgi:hypothetical protein